MASNNAAQQLPHATLQKAAQDTWTHLLAMIWQSPTQTAQFALDGNHPLGYRYDLGDAVPGLPMLLSSMAHAGLLMPILSARAYACPECTSIKVLMREGCQDCQSDLVFEQSIIHHFDCAYQSIEQQFTRTIEGHLKCPKCQKYLKHLGLDHDKPGVGYYCQACHQTRSDIQVQGTCLNCHKQFTPEQHPTNLYHYRLSEQGIQHLFSHNQSTNHQFDKHYQSYKTLAKTNRLNTSVILLQALNQDNEPYLAQIANALASQETEEHVIITDYQAGNLCLLMPGVQLEEANAFVKDNFAHLQAMLRITVKDILE